MAITFPLGRPGPQPGRPDLFPESKPPENATSRPVRGRLVERLERLSFAYGEPGSPSLLFTPGVALGVLGAATSGIMKPWRSTLACFT